MKFKLLYTLLLISLSLFAQVNLGDDINTCYGDTIILDATTNNATTYQWFFNDTIINGETQAVLNITENGTYKVVVDVSGTVYQDEINAVFNPLPHSDYIAFVECDNDNTNDGFTVLDLSNYEEYMTTDVATHNVSFYLSMADAENNTNPIISPYTNISNPQVFYARVENTTTECFTLSNLTLSVYIHPTSLDTLTMCETDGDGFEQFDLNNVNATAADTINFYASLTDAENETNPLSTNYTNTTNPQTIYTKITNNIGCTYIATVDLEVFDQPIITTPSDLEDCHVEFDGYVPFNLSTKNIEILNGLDTDVYQLTYHTSQYFADNGYSALTENPYYANENKTIYVRVENITTGCFTTTTMNLLIIQEQITTPTHLYTCDDDNNGVEAFDLTTKSDEILNGSGSSLQFYNNYYDAQNNTNPIINPSAYNNTSTNQIIYAKAENADGCFSNIINFQLRFSNPEITIGSDYFVCFNENYVILNPGFNNLIYDLEWKDENNTILSTGNIYLATETGTYYLTVTHQDTGCSSTATINVEFGQSFTVNTPTNINQCLDNTTQMATFDLTSIEDQLGISLAEYAISYHISPDYASMGIIPINNPQVFISDTSELYFSEIWIRIVEMMNGCAVTVPLIINALDCNDDDSDGIPNHEEDLNNNGDLTDDDTDDDGIPNYQDSDDDGDNVETNVETTTTTLNKNTNSFIDTDGDLIENYLDNDDDGDGVLTIDEDYNNNGDPTDDDTNNNNIPDYLESSVALSISNFITSNFSIYPNPATTEININFKDYFLKNIRVSIYNLQGQLVLNELTLDSKVTSISTFHLKSGIYFLNFKNENSNFTKKLIIK